MPEKTKGREWQKSKATLSGRAAAEPVLTTAGEEQGHVFRLGKKFLNMTLPAHSFNTYQ